VDINTEHFTLHGLQMKVSGEEKIARKISDVRKIVTKKKVKSIILKWKETSLKVVMKKVK
jgi:hypothetical protein